MKLASVQTKPINNLNNLFKCRLEAVKVILSQLEDLKNKIMNEVEKLLAETGFSDVIAIIPKVFPIDYYDITSLNGKSINKVVLVLSFKPKYLFDFKSLEKEDPKFAKEVKANLNVVRKRISEIMHKYGLKYTQKYGYYIAFEAYYTY